MEYALKQLTREKKLEIISEWKVSGSDFASLQTDQYYKGTKTQ